MGPLWGPCGALVGPLWGRGLGGFTVPVGVVVDAAHLLAGLQQVEDAGCVPALLLDL